MILVKTVRDIRRARKMYKFFSAAKKQGHQPPGPIKFWQLYKAVRTP